MFELKKVMSALLMPLPALLIIGLLGLALISFTTKRKTGCFVVLFSFVGIFLVAFQPVSTKLLMPLEREYKAFLPVSGTVDYVMVLGNGHVVDDEIPPTSQLSRTALMRLTEGIRILRMYPGAKLILSGYAGGSEISHARMMANVALSLGVEGLPARRGGHSLYLAAYFQHGGGDRHRNAGDQAQLPDPGRSLPHLL